MSMERRAYRLLSREVGRHFPPDSSVGGPFYKIEQEIYSDRLSTFTKACGRLSYLIETPNEIQGQDYGRVNTLRNVLRGSELPPFSELVTIDRVKLLNGKASEEHIRKFTALEQIIQKVMRRDEYARAILPDDGNSPARLTHLLINGYAVWMGEYFTYNEVANAVQHALIEVIQRDFADTRLSAELPEEKTFRLTNVLSRFTPRTTDLILAPQSRKTDGKNLEHIIADGQVEPFDLFPDVSSMVKLATFLRQKELLLATEDRRKLLSIISVSHNIGPAVTALLASSSEEQRNFGRVFLEIGYPTYYQLEKQEWDIRGNRTVSTRVHDVINTNCEDGKVFWTYAPELLAALKKNMPEREALKRILLWAKNGHPDEYGYDPTRVHLTGLELLSRQQANGKMYVLNRDPQSISQQFTREVAQRIVLDYLLTDVFDPDKAFLQ